MPSCCCRPNAGSHSCRPRVALASGPILSSGQPSRGSRGCWSVCCVAKAKRVGIVGDRRRRWPCTCGGSATQTRSFAGHGRRLPRRWPNLWACPATTTRSLAGRLPRREARSCARSASSTLSVGCRSCRSNPRAMRLDGRPSKPALGAGPGSRCRRRESLRRGVFGWASLEPGQSPARRSEPARTLTDEQVGGSRTRRRRQPRFDLLPGCDGSR